MIKRVDRYVGRAAVLGIVAVWVTMTLLAITFGLLNELRATTGDYGTLEAFWFTFLTMPRTAYQMFPVSALIGALIGVGGLAAGNELVAFRTAGVSRLRLAGAAMGGALMVTAAVMVIGEWVAPVAEQQGRAFRLGKVFDQAIVGGQRGIWIRDGDQVVNIQLPLLSDDRAGQFVEFRDVVIYAFADGNRLRSVTRADTAIHDGQGWTLRDASRLDIDAQAVRARELARSDWRSNIEPDLLNAAVTRPPYMSIRSLFAQVRFLGRNGLDNRVYKAEFFAKIFFPLSVLALVLAGMPFVFGSARHHNVGFRIFIGMSVGVLFTIANGAMQNIGSAYGLHAAFSALLPSMLIAGIAIAVLRRSV
ncbi:MAG: LPS export ABC transporter permease LptG [Xanthomonadales bacterium]|nr:LPS export ABC transporter permease LptG [Xanthomonadales bacterium]